MTYLAIYLACLAIYLACLAHLAYLAHIYLTYLAPVYLTVRSIAA